ncbi:para-nitrobenzyl esterase [Microbacterium resistens]|uniref:Carboxylic ester hydrolase n=1 Tax=Microbacterium resistens TaxID=156977 RepID=A0ABU1SG80_9MICO|nr:carboxylesterase family protein [Microbacterium resistens]MDR6868596.1 para-nitrobenzyl esterase [Microbacterium resistens]
MSDAASAPIVRTVAGRVRGAASDDGLAFLGIPYAQDPVGDRRFAPPLPHPGWDGIRATETVRPAAPQTEDLGRREMFGLPDYGIDEASCLTLNVWTPASDGRRHPVLVWIHGGAFSWGSGGDPVYDGARLSSRRDVVVVTVNYRLGALGFLRLPQVPGSGALGLLDQVEALRWVRSNIAAFGGDPDAVTLFGQSAGAVSIAAHLAAPASRGLYQRAILQSGSGEMLLDAAAADERAAEFADILGVGLHDLDALRALPVADILRAQAEFDRRLEERGQLAAFLPVVDGTFLDEQPLAAIRAGSSADVPILLGSAREEGRLFTELIAGPEIDQEGVMAVLRGSYADPEEAAAGYADEERWTDPRSIVAAVLGDELFRAPTDRLALAAAARRSAVWRYEFAYRSGAEGKDLGACHSLELPFVFDLLDTPAGRRFAGERAPQEIAERMGAAWAAFAAGGDPGWPRYESEDRFTLVLDEEIAVVSDPLSERRALWTRAGLAGTR